MELSGAERAVAWVSLVLAAVVLVVSLDLLTGGRVLGRPGVVVESEAGGDE